MVVHRGHAAVLASGLVDVVLHVVMVLAVVAAGGGGVVAVVAVGVHHTGVQRVGDRDQLLHPHIHGAQVRSLQARQHAALQLQPPLLHFTSLSAVFQLY